MPVYEYKCSECSKAATLIRAADDRDKDLPQCSDCDSGLKRVYSSIGVAFRGSGFYSTDK